MKSAFFWTLCTIIARVCIQFSEGLKDCVLQVSYNAQKF